jgi:hypothetical protein
MSSLSDKTPLNDLELCVFYDFETTQNTPYTDTLVEHVPNLVCPVILNRVRGRHTMCIARCVVTGDTFCTDLVGISCETRLNLDRLWAGS